MRRQKQSLTAKQIETVIQRNTYGVLSLCDIDGQPYGVPLNYVYEDGCFYFHCAQNGYKTDLLDANGKASFCIVDNDTLVPEIFSTDYISVIAFGEITRVTDVDEKMRTLWLLTDVLGDPDQGKKEKEINGSFSHVEMLCFKAEHITGKASSSIMKKQEDYFSES
ncbi:MAG: pyridoxamine 5'-phosphate oxidase family protein [Firmicutes bacterium]|nr:pyridoxamine 5'-phosphate oxidase family protein [Bacillota bacterium]